MCNQKQTHTYETYQSQSYRLLYGGRVALSIKKPVRSRYNMPVFRAEKVNDYAVIAKHHLKNKALSYKAKGLMTFMLSLPEDWDYSQAGLAKLSSDGVDSVRSGIKELEEHGYLTRRRIRDAAGKLGDIEYTIHEIPLTPHDGKPDKQTREPPSKPKIPTSSKPKLENPTLDVSITDAPAPKEPILDFPTQGKPSQILPAQENPMEISTKELSIKELSIEELNNKNTTPLSLSAANAGSVNVGQISPEDAAHSHQQAECLTVQTAQGAGKPVIHTMTLVEQQFEQFWQSYPRKASKKAAKKAWIDIKPDDALFSTIMASLNAAKKYWSLQGIQQRHIPHPSTWLSEERWEDEFSPDEQLGARNRVPAGNDKGVEPNATIGAGYTIGGENDPYRALIQA